MKYNNSSLYGRNSNNNSNNNPKFNYPSNDSTHSKAVLTSLLHNALVLLGKVSQGPIAAMLDTGSQINFVTLCYVTLS